MSQTAGGTHVKQYDNLKTLLKGAKSTSGQDLYQHLQETFKRLILHYPGEAYEKLEEVSYLLKQQGQPGGIKMEDFLLTEEIHNYSAVAEGLKAYIERSQGASKKKPAAEDGAEDAGQEEAAEVGPIGNISDFIADQKILEWAGIGFGEIESFRIMKALKELAKTSQASQVRFFGRIQGSEKDYYVAETVVEGGEEGGDEAKPADMEPKGSGVNKFTYFVTDNSFATWTKLPDLSPADIRAARSIKVVLTGDLERAIFTNPFFFGKEKHYLRAQIARISHSTTIVPKGLHKVNEENEREIDDFTPEEGQPGPTINAQTQVKAENWVHHTPGILKIGRTVHAELGDLPDGVDPEAEKKKIEAADPYDKRIKQISLDREVFIGGTGKNSKQTPWVLRILGDQTEYFNPLKPSQKISNAVVVVRSLHWPGSYTIFYQGRTLSIYIGSGHKYEGGTPQAGYFPVLPPKILDDPAEFKEQPEPTPLTLEVKQEVIPEPKPDGEDGNPDQEDP